MYVIFLVAIDTQVRCVEEFLRLVAVLAFGFTVHTDQWECCQVVIESDLVRPFCIVMAVAAGFTEDAFMRVVISVAGIALRLEKNFCGGLRMAILAGIGTANMSC